MTQCVTLKCSNKEMTQQEREKELLEEKEKKELKSKLWKYFSSYSINLNLEQLRSIDEIIGGKNK
jgi:hypothetical protein